MTEKSGYSAVPTQHAVYSNQGTTVVVSATHQICPNCHQPTLIERTNTVAFVLLIILIIVWFPCGFYYLCCMGGIKHKRCTNCGQTTDDNARWIYVLFGVTVAIYVLAIIAMILIFAVYWAQINKLVYERCQDQKDQVSCTDFRGAHKCCWQNGGYCGLC